MVPEKYNELHKEGGENVVSLQIVVLEEVEIRGLLVSVTRDLYLEVVNSK